MFSTNACLNQIQAPHLSQKFTIQTTSEHLTQYELTHGFHSLLTFHFLDVENYFVITKIGWKGSKENWTGAETRCQNFKALE